MSDEKKIFKSAADILASDDLVREDVWIEAWGTWVCVRSLTGTQRDAFEESMQKPGAEKGETTLENIRAKLVSQSVVDPKTGKLLFSPDQVATLGQKSAAALQAIFVVAKRLSALTDADVDELEKNSGGGQNGSSGSS